MLKLTTYSRRFDPSEKSQARDRSSATVAVSICLMTTFLVIYGFGSNSSDFPATVFQTGMSDTGYAIAFSHDGHLLATGGKDRSLKLWDGKSGHIIRTFPATPTMTYFLSFLDHDGQLLSVGPDGVARFWDPKTGNQIRTFVLFATAPALGRPASPRLTVWDRPFSLSFDEKTIVAGSDDGKIARYDVATGEQLGAFSVASATISSLSLDPSGRRIAILDVNKKLEIVGETGKDICNSQVAKTAASVLFIPQRQQLMVVQSDGNLLSLNPSTCQAVGAGVDVGRKIQPFVAVSSDGARVATFDSPEYGFRDELSASRIRIWDANGRQLQELAGMPNIGGAAFNSANTQLAVVGAAISLWDVRSWHLELESARSVGYVQSLAFGGCGHALALGLFDQKSSKLVWDLDSAVGPRSVLSLPYSKHVLFSGFDFWLTTNRVTQHGEVKVEQLSPAGSKVLASLDSHPLSVVPSPDGKYLAGLGYGGKSTVWKLGTVLSETSCSNVPEATYFSPGIFSSDSRSLIRIERTGGATITDVGACRVIDRFEAVPGVYSLAVDRGGRFLVGGGVDGKVRVWSLKRWHQLAPPFGHSMPVNSVSLDSTGTILATASQDGSTKLWGIRDPEHPVELARLVVLRDLSALVAAPSGQFDASNPDSIEGIDWVFPDDPFRALSPEIFMRDYYEPRLLPRLLSGDALPKVRPLQDLNRVQPEVKIVSVRRGTSADVAEVTVEVSRAGGQFQRDGKSVMMKTDVYDLRLFRTGQLVGQEPEAKAEVEESLKNGVELTGEQLQAWRKARRVKPEGERVKLDPATGKLQRTFVVRLPHGHAGKEIEFTAYAFNEDRVKSETAKANYTVPKEVGLVYRRAYVVSMGVNAYENQGWDLHFAASDAKRLQDALAKRLSGYAVVPVTLISDCRTEGCPEIGDRSVGKNHATKAALHAVLEKLAGHELSEELKKSLPPGAEKVERAGPDDLVVLSVSSHGYTSKEGTFYMVPSDSGQTVGRQVTPELLQHWVSSDELSAWLREVDAGDMVMIVDTCHSAATVEAPGFKPGPMGSRGLGQLGYDKGMRILSASQADDVALESEMLKQGLLTYALVENGLEDRQAAGTEGKITMEGWLQYGADRVPTLYNEVLAGKVQKFTAHSKDTSIDEELSDGTSSLRKPNAFQQPSFFNFRKAESQMVLVESR